MSGDAPQACKRCGLLSPAAAARCQCGFDFIENRHGLTHTERGLQQHLRTIANGQIWVGLFLALAGFVIGWAAIPGVLLIVRGLHKRRGLAKPDAGPAPVDARPQLVGRPCTVCHTTINYKADATYCGSCDVPL